jgi:hypothetical protein
LSLTPDQLRRPSAFRGKAAGRAPPQIRNRYQAFSHPPPEQQHSQSGSSNASATCRRRNARNWKRRFESMTPQERRGLTALRATQQADGARNNWNRIPEKDRAATRAMLDSMTPPERQKLRRIMQRSTPEERRALHQRVLAMNAAERSQWLAEQP